MHPVLAMDLRRPPTDSTALDVFARLASAVLVVVILTMGRPVFLPIALAAVLAFVLTPPVRWLERRITRLPALVLVMLLAVGGLGSAGFVVASQVGELTTGLAKYTESMRRKVSALRDGSGGPVARIEAMVARVSDGLERRSEADTTVRVAPAPLSAAAQLGNVVRPLADPALTFLVVLVLCVFMLGQRDDLRNRLIRLVGTRSVTATTRTLDDGAQRIARYLLVQSLINTGFGAVVGLGLLGLGIPHAALWGALAGTARFVPYLGAAAAMVLPAALAFAIFPGWDRTLLTVALFLGMDFVAGYAVEPLLVGRHTGVSSIALLISALFWAWIWGPVGLLLSTPITVALVVLGRHVPGLQFMAVLLGDDQVIGEEVSFYQRLLARDEEGAAQLAQGRRDTLGFGGVMDAMVIPSLVLASGDLARRAITPEDQAFIVTWSRDICEHLAGPALPPAPPGQGAVRALGVAALRGESELLLEMLSVEVASVEERLLLVPASSSVEEVLVEVARLQPELVFLAGVPPECGPSLRQLCHRLRAGHPGLYLAVLRPPVQGVDPAAALQRLREAGADLVVPTLAEARLALSARLTSRAAAPAPAQGGSVFADVRGRSYPA